MCKPSAVWLVGMSHRMFHADLLARLDREGLPHVRPAVDGQSVPFHSATGPYSETVAGTDARAENGGLLVKTAHTFVNAVVRLAVHVVDAIAVDVGVVMSMDACRLYQRQQQPLHQL